MRATLIFESPIRFKGFQVSERSPYRSWPLGFGFQLIWVPVHAVLSRTKQLRIGPYLRLLSSKSHTPQTLGPKPYRFAFAGG